MIRLIALFLYCTTLFAYDYQFGIVLIFRDEGRFLKEWIEYHRVVGAEHFWLYNNLSKDNYLEVLDPYIKEGLVDLIDVPIETGNIQIWNSLQTRTYNRALAQIRGKCKWVAVIDADEFIVPLEDETITESLKKYEQYPAVALHWLIFGTSFVEKIPDDHLMIESLNYRGVFSTEENRYVKLIVKPEDAVGFNGPHMCAFMNGTAVNTKFIPVRNKIDYNITHNVMRINHYWSRDLDYLENIKIPRSKTSGGNWAIHMEKEVNEFNLIEDNDIHVFVPQVKERVFSSLVK